MISLLHRSIGYEALVLFVVVLAVCLAAHWLLLGRGSHRLSRIRPVLVAGRSRRPAPVSGATLSPEARQVLSDDHREDAHWEDDER